MLIAQAEAHPVGVRPVQVGVAVHHLFYGAYSAEADEDNPPDSDDMQGYESVGTDSSGWTRQMASGRYDSPNSYWWQHDFFVHDGTVDTGNSTENGQWLRSAWYTAVNGGFDGRWVQLFDDRPGLEP